MLENAAEHPIVEGRELRFGGSTEQLADTLSKLIAPYASYSASQTQRVMKYSPRYRLAFTLLNEEATSGSAALAWDVQDAIQSAAAAVPCPSESPKLTVSLHLHDMLAHVGPLLKKLSDLHNFTIESQVQYHAPLAFQPRPLQHEGQDVHGLTQEDLTVFVNSAEWTLCMYQLAGYMCPEYESSPSSSQHQVYLATLSYTLCCSYLPLRTALCTSSTSKVCICASSCPHTGSNPPAGSVHPSNAFLLPQWGGIVLLNPPKEASPIARLTPADLRPIFATFAYQLLTLLGVPGLPLHIRTAQREPFTDWELDALLRQRAFENVQGSADTLEAIVRLVDQIENMPVGQDVVGDVQDALDALNEVRRQPLFSYSWCSNQDISGRRMTRRAHHRP